MEAAFQYAPDAAERWTVKSVKAAIEEQSGFSFLAWLPAPIRPSLSQSLLRLIQSDAVALQCLARMVELLWQHPLPGLAGWVEEVLRSSDATTPRHADRTSLLCQVLVARGEAQHWPWIWDVIKRSDEVGRIVFTTMAERSYHFDLPRILKGVAEGDLARLWEWAVRQFPPAVYPQQHGSGTVTQAELIAGSRDQLLIRLGDLGTSGACEQLSRLAAAYPEFSRIRQLERQAFANRRKNEWKPIDPRLLFQMPRSPRSRWVESEEQLLEVIIDSLKEFETRLQGPNPLARMLWNDSSGERGPTPKLEDAVSDWVTSELRRDLQARGIVLNREVVVRPTDRLDILVQASCRDAKADQFRQIRVIIEVKRDFNPGIDHALETQLSQRYLSDNDCHTGLYLVAWFNRNRQRGEKAQERLMEFRAKLEAQAAKESSAGKNLRAWVLDCSLPRPAQLTKPKSRTKPAAPGKSAQGRRMQRSARKN